MSGRDGGEHETGVTTESGLAPVIPLFGQRRERPGAPRRSAGEPARQASGADDRPLDLPSPPSRTDLTTSTGRAPARGSATASFVPGVDPHDAPAHSTDANSSEADAQGVRAAAESTLLRRLRTRQLSVSEARGVAVGAGMTPDDADALISRFERLGYLDDAALAEQLVHSAVERKGQGRQAIGPLLSRRGIARDVADEAIAALPDDDLQRAVEFARSKARSLGARDRDTALRRLLGQLARRGYPSSIAMTAARQVLDEP